MTSASPVTLGLRAGHYAFMRAVVQGLDWRESWQRYLAQDDMPADAQAVRAEIERIRWAFAAAARRARRPGLARLVLLDAQVVSEPEKPLPSLEEFALDAGLEDFSYQEQSAAYEARYGASLARRRGATRRARIVARQLEALTWLEAQSGTFPIDGDPISAWLAPRMCRAMASVGIDTVGDLKTWVAQRGERWIQPLRTLGPVKGARLLAWLREQGIDPLSLHRHGTPARRRGAGLAQTSAADMGTGIRPLELYVPPAALNATHDIDLIVRWVARVAKVTACGTAEEASPPSSAQDLACRPLSATQKCYRREAERLLLWAHLIQGCRLTELSRAACAAYLDFLQEPTPHFQWCGPRGGQRWSATWRPFEGPLSAAARQQSLVILRGLFRFALTQQVDAAAIQTRRNPWEGLAVPGARSATRERQAAHRLQARRAGPGLTVLQAHTDVRSDRARIAWLCRHELGLRLQDIVQLTWRQFDSLMACRRSSEVTIAQIEAAVCRYRQALTERLAASSVDPTSPVFPKLPQVATSKRALPGSRPSDAMGALSAAPVAQTISPSALCQDMRRLERLGPSWRLSD